MTALTKAQRRAAGKKAYATRLTNQARAKNKLLGEKAESSHDIELPEDERTTEQSVSGAMGFEIPTA